ncbi:ribulose-bisphosphate carboxylase large subunit, partial [Acinetobacter pittii]|nr:ribulose-bisphosphate carboxylase large subunit [Acinetobacter pittii]
GRDILHEGPSILKQAAQHSPALAAALELWKDVTFDYTSTDTADVLPTPTL